MQAQEMYVGNIALPDDSVTITDRAKKARLGDGSFARVYRGEYKGKSCAVKVFKEDVLKKDFSPNPADKLTFLLPVVRHTNIVQMYGVWYDQYKANVVASIVMELCDESLCDAINKKKKSALGHKQKLLVLSDITKGMVCLHSNNIIHGNLHTGNVLLCHSGRKTVAKLADYGMNRYCGPALQHGLHTKHTAENFYPPEVLNHKGPIEEQSLTPKVDIFCFGELALEIAIGSYPTPDKLKVHQTVTEVQRRQRHLAKLGKSDQENLDLIIRKCLSDTPEGRPAFTDILSDIQGHLHMYGEWSDFARLQNKTVSNQHTHTHSTPPHTHIHAHFMTLSAGYN